jgi:hypothetical protein
LIFEVIEVDALEIQPACSVSVGIDRRSHSTYYSDQELCPDGLNAETSAYRDRSE